MLHTLTQCTVVTFIICTAFDSCKVHTTMVISATRSACSMQGKRPDGADSIELSEARGESSRQVCDMHHTIKRGRPGSASSLALPSEALRPTLPRQCLYGHQLGHGFHLLESGALASSLKPTAWVTPSESYAPSPYSGHAPAPALLAAGEWRCGSWQLLPHVKVSSHSAALSRSSTVDRSLTL